MDATICYGLLCISICSNWLKPTVNKYKVVTLFLFLLSLISGIFFNYIAPYTILTAALIMSASYIYFYGTKFKWIGFSVLFILSLLLALHIFPGFNNYNVFKNIILTSDSVPYSLFLNFDKATAGFSILFFQTGLIKNLSELKYCLKKIIILGILSITTIMLLSFIIGIIKFEPKIPWFIGIFIISNLFFTCIAEELFFRKLIQDNIKTVFYKSKYSKLLGITASASVFGIVHLAGGIRYCLVAFVAGIFYAYIYEKTKKVEAPIFVHFFLNLIHILFFTYPALK